MRNQKCLIMYKCVVQKVSKVCFLCSGTHLSSNVRALAAFATQLKEMFSCLYYILQENLAEILNYKYSIPQMKLPNSGFIVCTFLYFVNDTEQVQLLENDVVGLEFVADKAPWSYTHSQNWCEVHNGEKLLSVRHRGLMVSAHISGSISPGLSPGWRHCVMQLGRALFSHSACLYPGDGYR